MSSDVDTAEIGVLRLAMVSLGSHHSLTRDLDTWYTLPETLDHGDQGTGEADQETDMSGNKVIEHSNY